MRDGRKCEQGTSWGQSPTLGIEAISALDGYFGLHDSGERVVPLY